MPNWCENNVKITGSKEKIKEIHEGLLKGKFFATIIPEPDYSRTPVAPSYPDIAKIKGQTTEPTIRENSWWDWRISNWGTKWELSKDDSGGLLLSEDETELSGFFSTAWSPPKGVYSKLVEDMECKVYATYYEPGCSFAGIWDNGSDNYIDLPEEDDFFINTETGKILDDHFNILEEREICREESNNFLRRN